MWLIRQDDNDNDHYNQAKAAEAAERAAFCRGELEEVLCFFLIHPERCFAIIFFRMSVQIVPEKKSQQKFWSKIAHLNQVNFCPEAAHASCPSNGRKGSFSPLEARARYLFIIIIISRSIEAFRAPTSSRASWLVLCALRTLRPCDPRI